ncbi:hypothetical protein [Hymenobacter sp. YC55]|uniref:hypothetical protein n=1 Tax=Hymenobacter sp. YC55 TaxID=3034019 RepID=UPI0023F7120D|nr:hypothetical protein [Hymenobacter sp. YC55]MDF7815172.1 hypothetical protein [Hymenobacter sp. YC55]
MTIVAHMSQLLDILDRLQQLPSERYSPLDKQLLRELLSATLHNLHELYPDHLSHYQRYRLISNLHSLELQFLAITPGNEVPEHVWPTVQEALQLTINATLANISDAHGKS